MAGEGATHDHAVPPQPLYLNGGGDPCSTLNGGDSVLSVKRPTTQAV